MCSPESVNCAVGVSSDVVFVTPRFAMLFPPPNDEPEVCWSISFTVQAKGNHRT